MVSIESLSPEEEAAIRTGLEAAADGRVEFVYPEVIIGTLEELWSFNHPESFSLHERAAHYPSTVPDWYVGMSPDFRKSTQNIDRKLQGRIFQAIAQISTEPTTPRGDTVKPLVSELKGLWRYRIGDFRLVYHPDIETGRITLLAFAGRGSVYG